MAWTSLAQRSPDVAIGLGCPEAVKGISSQFFSPKLKKQPKGGALSCTKEAEPGECFLCCPLSLPFQTSVPLSIQKSLGACHIWQSGLPDQDCQLQTWDGTGGAIYHSRLSRKILFRSLALNRQGTVLIKVLFTLKGHRGEKNPIKLSLGF